MPRSISSDEAEDPRFGKIAEASRALVVLRDRWLNPEDLSEDELKKRTLTSLYNDMPPWLRIAHAQLDRAVFAAYGWREDPDDLPGEEMLQRLLALNLERSGI